MTPTVTQTTTVASSVTATPVAPLATATATPTTTSTVTLQPTPSITNTPRNAFTDVDLTGRLFLVYPNPARDQVRFLLNPDRSVQVKIQLANLNGETVATVTDSLPAGRGVITWDCQSMASGLYLTRILMDGKEVGKAKVAVVR
jgi:hypothetical protein